MADIEHPDFNPDRLDKDQLIIKRYPIKRYPMQTLEEVKEYLDGCIIYWRGERKKSENIEPRIMASHYIDAFQSTRISIFGEELPE